MTSVTRRAFLQGSTAALSSVGLLRHTPSVHAQPRSIMQEKLRFGVNYVPRKRWWYCWLDWDLQSVSDDLQAIADLGMDHIRIQCLWPFFQPGINYISDAMLERLHLLLDSADRAGLDVEVTVLNGWMSGIAFMPPWVSRRNIFTDLEIIEAEKLLFRRIAETIGTHPRFLGFDLGNELGVLMGSNPATSLQADAWADEIFRFCDEVAPGKFHVNGVDHEHWFADFGFTRENLATMGKATVVHSYAYFTDALKRYGYSGIGALHLIEYMIEFAYAYQTYPARRVWVEEVGVSPSWVPANYLIEYTDQIVRNAANTGKAWGITWWCSHDLAPGIKGFNNLEYTLGLIGQDNKPKPLGRKLAALANELRNKPTSHTNRETALVVPDRGLAKNPSSPDWAYGDRYMKLIAEGKNPCIVLESRIQDEVYLRSRGITNLVRLASTTASG